MTIKQMVFDLVEDARGSQEPAESLDGLVAAFEGRLDSLPVGDDRPIYEELYSVASNLYEEAERIDGRPADLDERLDQLIAIAEPFARRIFAMTHSNLDRRQFMRLNAAALAGTTLASSVAKGTEPLPGEKAGAARHNPPPGFYRFALGDLEITVVSDGFFHLSEITPDEMEPLETLAVNEDEETRQEYFRSRLIHTGDVRLPICPVLIDSNDQRVLVDSGWSGGSPTAGQLGSSLELLGVAPESIDVVILTHGHPDHVGGLLHPVTKAPIYPNAEVVVAQAEFDFWTGDDARPILANPLLAGIPGILEALDERLRLIEAGDEAANGIWSISSPGHTPGHICLVVEAGGRELLLTGDAIVNIHTCFEHPDWHKFFDFEREQAARTRRRLLDRAANDEMLILGYHFPFPGLGYALRAGDAYRWYSAGSTMLP